MGKRAFQLCQDQTKNINKFIHNRFVLFLRILSTPKINKVIFMEIVNSNTKEIDFQQYSEEPEMVESKEVKAQIKEISYELKQKRILVFVPIAIPSTGKSSLFRKIRAISKMELEILSSDTVREEVMTEKMKKNKTMTKKDAYQKSGKQASEKYYNYMGAIFKKFMKS